LDELLGRYHRLRRTCALHERRARHDLEVDHWRARIGDRDSVEPFDLRVTTTFRRENGAWKIVHRHADPISTEDDVGPLRTS
jgi:ketosteroid isomerase-like protein